MERFQDFKDWFSKELHKYPMLEKSNPLSPNELCYVLRKSGADYSVNWSTSTGFASVQSVCETFIPSWELAQKVRLDGYDEDFEDGKAYRSVTMKIIDRALCLDSFDKRGVSNA